MSLFSPPLEEEWNACVEALVADFGHSRRVDAAGTGGGFAAQIRTYPKLAADDIIANMSTLELSDEQVISLVRGLPAERKRAALLALAQEAQAGREDRLRWAEAQLRRASAKRGLDWDRLSEDERESFVDVLLHEK
jgi:hypothetical protein